MRIPRGAVLSMRFVGNIEVFILAWPVLSYMINILTGRMGSQGLRRGCGQFSELLKANHHNKYSLTACK